MPFYVYFILKGDVFLTNSTGTFHYIKLTSGSYFGDINVILKYPSSYSTL